MRKGTNKRTNVSYGNPIIADIEHQKMMLRHREQLKKMQCSIDNNPPAPQPHLQLFGRDYFAKKRATTEAAFQDLKMIQSIARTMTRPVEAPRGLPSGPIKSLNHSHRKKELFRITMENHLLLERLEKTQPMMNNQKLEEEAVARRLHMINCSYSARRNGLYDDLLGKRTHKLKLSKTGAESAPTLPAIENQTHATELPPNVVPDPPAEVAPAAPVAARRVATGGDDEVVATDEEVKEEYENEEFEKEYEEEFEQSDA
ncbi:unnamed protein product [Amoebophrya sp. A120]|nr:unnamed protein product [Amoebophrya sp. A120]|eukprot:GSA120T00002235001.1